MCNSPLDVRSENEPPLSFSTATRAWVRTTMKVVHSHVRGLEVVHLMLTFAASSQQINAMRDIS